VIDPNQPMVWRYGATQYAVRTHSGTWLAGPFNAKRDAVKALKSLRAASARD
jgi:hypothetical protein